MCFVHYILSTLEELDRFEDDAVSNTPGDAVGQGREWGREIERFERHSCQFPFDAIS